MLYENLVTENRSAFLARVQEVANLLRIPADWLMIVFKVESSMNHRAINPKSKAVGLIQFMPNTAKGLGTTSEQLLNMSNVKQLDYVYQYFSPWKGRLNSVQDLYTVTFFPRALGKTDDYVLKTDTISAGAIAAQNDDYDLNKDNQITYGELKAAITRKLPSDVVEFLKKK